MNPKPELDSGRRQFFTVLAPACALTCLGVGLACAQSPSGQGKTAQGDPAPAPTHPFDAEFERKLTYRQFLRAQYRDSIALAKALQEELGKEKTLEFLRRHRSRLMREYGQAQAARTEDRSLRSYTKQFSQPGNYSNTLVMEIVEDSDRAFELKVTECLWASTFREAEAGELGHAMVCHGDFAWAEGFDSRIKLVRDKTLMEGDAICNHRYVWQG